MGMEMKGNQKVVSAEAPLAEMFGYATAFRSLTSGRANAPWEFDKYVPVPSEIAAKIYEEARPSVKKRNPDGYLFWFYGSCLGGSSQGRLSCRSRTPAQFL